MYKISSKNQPLINKKANLPTVLVIIIVIAFVMFAIIGFLTALINKQFDAKTDASEYDRTNSIISIVEMQGENIIKSILPNDDVAWSDFVSNNEELIVSQLNMVIPSDLKDYIGNITVSYREAVERYVKDRPPNGYSCIVISFTVTEGGANKICNTGFFIKNAPSYTNDGADFEKGELVFSWMS